MQAIFLAGTLGHVAEAISCEHSENVQEKSGGDWGISRDKAPRNQHSFASRLQAGSNPMNLVYQHSTEWENLRRRPQDVFMQRWFTWGACCLCASGSGILPQVPSRWGVCGHLSWVTCLPGSQAISREFLMRVPKFLIYHVHWQICENLFWPFNIWWFLTPSNEAGDGNLGFNLGSLVNILMFNFSWSFELQWGLPLSMMMWSDWLKVASSFKSSWQTWRDRKRTLRNEQSTDYATETRFWR